MLGGYLAGGGFALETIFYILAGLGVFGGLLTLLVPSPKGKVEVKATMIEPRHKPEARAASMYKRVLLAIDAGRSDGTDCTLKRTAQLGLMTGARVHLLCIQHSHIVPGSISQVSPPGALPAVNDVEAVDRKVVQTMVDRLAAAGVDARGELVSATEHDIADVVLERVDADGIDLLIIEHEYQSGHALRASVAEQVIRQHPTISILLARPPAAS